MALRIETLSGASSSFRELVSEGLIERHPVGSGVREPALPAGPSGARPELSSSPVADRPSLGDGSFESRPWEGLTGRVAEATPERLTPPEPAPRYEPRPPPAPHHDPAPEAPEREPSRGWTDDATGDVIERRLGEVQRGLLGVQGGLRELAHASDAMGRTLRGLADGTIRLPSIDAVEERTDELGRRVLRRLDGVEQSLGAAVRDEQAWLRASLAPELGAKAQTAIVASLEPLERALHDRLDESVDATVSGLVGQLRETEEAVVQRLQEEFRAEQRSMSRRLEKRLDVLTQELSEQGGMGGRLDALGGEIEVLLKAEKGTALKLLSGRLNERLDALGEEIAALHKTEKATALKLTGIRDRLADACSALEGMGGAPGPDGPESEELLETSRLVAERLEELTREMQTVRRRLPVRGQAVPLDEEEELGLPGWTPGEPSPPGRRPRDQAPPDRGEVEQAPPALPRRRPGSSVKLGPGVARGKARNSSR